MNLFKDSKNNAECIKILRWLGSAEAQEFYPSELRPNPNSLLQEQFDLLAPQEFALIAKEIETGRLRLSTATESLDRLVDRVEVQNYSKDLTEILKDLTKLKPEKYLETYSRRLLKIVLSEFCPNEQVRKEYAAELLLFNNQFIKYNCTVGDQEDEIGDPQFFGPRNVFNQLKQSANEENYEKILKLFEQLEIVCKKWNRAFTIDYGNLLSSALKFRLRALIGLNYHEDALELASKFTNEDLLDDSIFDSVLSIFENGTLLTRAITLIEMKLMHVDPETPELILRLIDNLIELHRYNEALEYIEAVREAYPSESIDSKSRARISFSNGLCAWYFGDRKSKTTLADFLTAAKEDPSEAKYFAWIGKYYWRIEGEAQRALKCFSKALSLDGQSLQAALLYSEITLTLQSTEAAVVCELLKPFTALSSQARNRRLFYYYGVALFLRNDFIDASVAFQSALKGNLTLSPLEDPTSDPSISDENCLQWLGEAYLRSSRLGSAAKAFNRLATLRSDDLIAQTGLATVHLKSSNPIEAVDILESTNAESQRKVLLDKSQASLDLARFYLRQGRFISAMRAVISALNFFRADCPESMRMASDSFVLADSFQGIYGFPQADFEKFAAKSDFLTINPGLIEISNKLSKDFKSTSIKFALGALTLAFKDPSKHCLSAYWLQLAMGLSTIDTLDEYTISSAENSIKSKDSTSLLKSQAHHLLGLIYSRRSVKLRREAQHHFISALKSQETSTIWTDLGRFYLEAGDWELGTEAFKRALSVDQEDLVAAFELARASGTCEGTEAAKQIALRAFTTQPVHFTEEFAWILAENNQDTPLVCDYAKVYLKKRFKNHSKLKEFVYDASEENIPTFANKLELLNYLNSPENDPKIWISPLGIEFDCEFLLKRPENEVTQSGWRAVVEGLLPASRERTKKELEELEK